MTRTSSATPPIRRVFLALLFTMPALFHCNSQATTSHPRPYIIEGSDAKAADTRYMAGLVDTTASSNFKGQYCGASLISPQWVLTAAHCVYKLSSPSDIAVVTGTTSLGPDKTHRSRVAGLVMHPRYNNEKLLNDVALIALAEAADTPWISPATAAEVSALVLGDAVTISGWGRIDRDGENPEFPTRLQTITLNYIPQQICDEAGYYDFPVTQDQFCAGNIVGVTLPGAYPEILGGGICNGDSGGPLVRNGIQVGIASYGPDEENCAVAGVPDGYINVGHFHDWISQVMAHPDLAIEISARPAGPETFDLIVSIRNLSPLNPSPESLLTVEQTGGTSVNIEPAGPANPCEGGTLPFTCGIASITPGEVRELTFRIATPGTGSAWRIAASSTLDGDYNPDNNRSTAEANMPNRNSGGGAYAPLFTLLWLFIALRRKHLSRIR